MEDSSPDEDEEEDETEINFDEEMHENNNMM